MAQVTLRGNPINTQGDLPAVGAPAPDFTLVQTDLSPLSLSDFSGQSVVLNIFPSVDTPTCAQSVRTFNEQVASREGAVIINISRDLPFAQGRFCGAEGIENAKVASTFRSHEFGDAYGTTLIDGPLAGLEARAVVVVGADGNVAYTELVPEIAQEPDYDSAWAALDS